MGPKNPFLRCLGISTLVHAALFAVFPYQVLRAPLANRPIEVAYQASVGPVRQQPPDDTPKSGSRQDGRKVPEPFWKVNDSSRDLIKKDLFKKTEQPQIANRPLLNKNEQDAKKTVYMPSIPGETFKTPEYRSYYQIIREKIRRYAYLNYRKLEQGEVYLTFTLASDGTVDTVAVNKDKSNADAYLQAIAFDSVQEAAPYPPFPEKLKSHPKLSFNVIIAFELK